jgi:Mlc titration factor MtfA (ptsG expression regulator)
LKAEGAQDRWFTAAVTVLLVAAGATVGAIGHGSHGALGGALAGLAVAAALRAALARRGRRRRMAVAGPFPEPWRRVLVESYDHYHRLPEDLRARFEDDLRLFLADTRITGIEVEASDELRVLVAASAVTLSLGWPEFEWDAVTEVLLYPQDFDRDYSFEGKELAGQAHPWGTVIISVPSLRASFAHADDGFHVGLHEFTHLLDKAGGSFDGIPSGFPPARIPEWLEVMEREMERLRRGKSAIDPYGSDEPAEFLAVAVEAFFELPLELRRRHREVYALLSEYFRQDPARWDEARA